MTHARLAESPAAGRRVASGYLLHCLRVFQSATLEADAHTSTTSRSRRPRRNAPARAAYSDSGERLRQVCAVLVFPPALRYWYCRSPSAGLTTASSNPECTSDVTMRQNVRYTIMLRCSKLAPLAKEYGTEKAAASERTPRMPPQPRTSSSLGRGAAVVRVSPEPAIPIYGVGLCENPDQPKQDDRDAKDSACLQESPDAYAR